MMKQQRHDKTKKCRHFNGLINEKCEAEVRYKDHSASCCFGTTDGCISYSPFTAAELLKQQEDIDRHLTLMRKGLSSCCEAPFDTSRVLEAGPYKGHGPRYCSKCGRMCFIV